jgi:hypothetical protein
MSARSMMGFAASAPGVKASPTGGGSMPTSMGSNQVGGNNLAAAQVL